MRNHTSPLASVVTLRLNVAGGGGGVGSGGTTHPHAAAAAALPRVATESTTGVGGGCCCCCSWANKLVMMHARLKARREEVGAVLRSVIKLKNSSPRVEAQLDVVPVAATISVCFVTMRLFYMTQCSLRSA